MSYCLLDGVPVLGHKPVSWSLTVGTRPDMHGFEVTNAAAQNFHIAAPPVGRATVSRDRGGQDAAGPVSLVVNGAHFVGLWVVQIEAGSVPESATVVVADRRIFWSRTHVHASYNVRRRTGDRRAVGDGSGQVENARIVDDVAYAPYSLNSGARWSPREMAIDVFAQIGVDVELPSGFGRGVEIQDAIFDHPGDVAIEYLLRYCGGGYQIAVDRFGAVRVFDTTRRSEQLTGVPIVDGGGDIFVTSKRFMRPRSVRVLFTREVELRFDFVEGRQSQTPSKEAIATTPRDRSETVDDGRPPRDMANVIPVPESGLEVNGRKVGLRQYVDIEEYLDALKDDRANASVPTLTLEELRRLFHSPSLLEHTYAITDQGEYNEVWTRRIKAILQNWRITFRLNPVWRARLKSIKAMRVALIDPESGTRAPASAYAPYLRKPTIDGLIKKRAEGTRMLWQVGSYADRLSDAVAAPVDVTIKHEEWGIVRVFPLKDVFGYSEVMVPGEPENVPRWQADSDVTAAVVWHMSKLKDDFKMAVVLTGIQGAPNNSSALHAETVLPGEIDPGVADVSLGPVMEVRVDPGLATARFRWDDDFAEQIDAAFAKGEGDYPEDLIINQTEVGTTARAIATEVYARLSDRLEGRTAYAFSPAFYPDGEFTSVEHVLTPEGTVYTIVTASPPVNMPSVWSYMPAGIQQTLRRIAQQ